MLCTSLGLATGRNFIAGNTWWGHAVLEVQQIASRHSVVLPPCIPAISNGTTLHGWKCCRTLSPEGPINPAEVQIWSGADKSELVGGVWAWVRVFNWAWGYWGDILRSCKLMASGIFCLAILNLLFTNNLCLNQLATYWFIRMFFFLFISKCYLNEDRLW